MITITAVCLYLITHVVYGKIITVNNNGDNSSSCCVNGTCPCSCLSSALCNVSDNTVINITSELVTLHDIVGMGSGNLSNIIITGNGATIMCNNTGGVYCESCSNITIMGITWYQCGRNDSEQPVTQIPALNFTNVFNMTIHKCTFQNSSGCPVYLHHALERITIKDSYFMHNVFDDGLLTAQDCAGLYITSKRDLNISIISSVFHDNGCRKSDISKQYFYIATVLNLYHSHNLTNISIENTNFSNNSYAFYLYMFTAKSAILQLSNVSIYNNTVQGISLTMYSSNYSSVHIDMSYVFFMDNVNALTILNELQAKQLTVAINMSNSIISNNVANNDDTFNTNTENLGAIRIALTSAKTKVTIVNCHFYDNSNGAIGIYLSPPGDKCKSTSATITLMHVTISSTKIVNQNKYDIIASTSIVTSNVDRVNNDFINVSFISNNYSSYHGQGGVLFIENVENHENGITDYSVSTSLINCSFYNNTALENVVFLNIKQNANDETAALYSTQIHECNFDSNVDGKSIVYIQSATSSKLNIDSFVKLDNSKFSNNKGTALYLTATNFKFTSTSWFINNSANSGAAIYFKEVSSFTFDTDIYFINNSVLQKGGALYFNLVTDYCNVFIGSFDAVFINNSANIAGNSIYFSIPQDCHINTNTSDESSLLYFPNKFNYSQPGHTNSPPFVTSPYNIKLHPPAIAVDNSSNDYIMQQSRMLGEPIQINASVLDCLNNVTEPVIFTIICETCGGDYVLSAYQITAHDHTLSTLKVLPTASSDVINHANITIKMLSVLPPVYKSISTALVIKLSPCFTGYILDNMQEECICYPHPDIVHCTEQYSEIKIGYWIGPVTDKGRTSSSFCPSDYCDFVKRTETSQGYCNLPRKSDDQCSSHRTGVACGECKSGYTLAYDSPDCINTDECSAGMTILVIVLTILYWIAIVAVVFGLMYFQFQISSGYAYGIIYYYSIVDILLGNNISEEVFQLVAVFSSFAKLTPQLLGRLCLVEGLSGIDQQFIHYSHALAVSLILLIFVLVTRYSPRFAVFVRRCIICIICLLLLLAYTSLASTSLQLLRPLTFNDDIHEPRTYSSPDIKYFTGRHLVYAIVAILCEMIIVIGLPLFLLFEPILGRRFNFVKIKPLLDQFRGCYKDKYRYFAVYYLICRQVIILIVYVGNGDYYNKLYYLQTACIIIAMIHGWVQPYKKKLVNGLDEAILLTLVLVVNLNTFSFLSPISSQLSIVLIILPLLLLSLIGIRKLIIHCYNRKKKKIYLYNPVDVNEQFVEDEDNDNDDNDDNEANDIRNDEDININNMYNEFQEPLLNLSED